MFCCENIVKHSNGAFIRRFCWDLEKIIPSDAEEKSGYIVQRIERVTTDSHEKYSIRNDEIHNPYNHSYWEAWNVDTGAIKLPNFGYDDSWESMPNGWNIVCSYKRLVEMLRLFNERYNTNGCISMKGTVYWAPKGNELYEIVKTKFHEHICYANALPAAWKIALPQNCELIGNHSFSCSWDLSSEEKLINSVMSYISTCQESDKIRDAIKDAFESECLQRTVLEAYENIYLNIDKDAQRHIISKPSRVQDRMSRNKAKG